MSTSKYDLWNSSQLSPAAFDEAIVNMFAGRMTIEGECWVFTGRREGGYGRIRKGRRAILVHRHVLALRLNRALTANALHHCDNPPCFRPSHLYEGNQLQNAADCVARGRTARGERSPNAKLTAAQVKEARDLYATGTTSFRRLAAAYGVTHQAMRDVVQRKYWKEVV